MKVGELFYVLGMKISPEWGEAQKRIRAVASLSKQKDREIVSAERARVNESLRLARMEAREKARLLRQQARAARDQAYARHGLVAGVRRGIGTSMGIGGMGALGPGGAIAASIAVAAGAAKASMDLSDTYENMHNRLRMVAKSEEEVNQLFEKGRQVARNTRNDLEGTVTGFVRLAQSSEALKLGLSKEQIFERLELINMAIKNSGATSIEAKQGFRQLTQAIASNRLGGEEFRAVMEEIPAVGDAIAKSLNKSRGDLKKMSKDGELNAKVVMKAFDPLSKVGQKIREDFGRTQATFADGMQMFKDEVTIVVGDFMRDPTVREGLMVALKGALEVIKLAVGQLKLLFQLIRPSIENIRKSWERMSKNEGFMKVLKFIQGAFMHSLIAGMHILAATFKQFENVVFVIEKIASLWDDIKDTASTIASGFEYAFNKIAELPIIKQLLQLVDGIQNLLGSGGDQAPWWKDAMPAGMAKTMSETGQPATANSAAVNRSPSYSPFPWMGGSGTPVNLTNNITVKDAKDASIFAKKTASDIMDMALDNQNRHAAANFTIRR